MRRPRLPRRYRLTTPTLGVVEQVIEQGSLEPIIRWKWWAVGPLRTPDVAESAAVRADILLRRECGSLLEGPDGRSQGDSPDTPTAQWVFASSPQQPAHSPLGAIRAIAVDMAMQFGGRPDDWRRVRMRDIDYALRAHAWRNADEKKRGPRPRHGAS